MLHTEVEYCPGDWTAVIANDMFALISGTFPPGVVRSLWQCAQEGADYATHLETLSWTNYGELPGFALGCVNDDEVWLFLRGEAFAISECGIDVVQHTSRDAMTWTETVFYRPDRIELRARYDAQLGDIAWPMRDGIVAANGVSIVLTHSEQNSPRVDSPERRKAPTASGITVLDAQLPPLVNQDDITTLKVQFHDLTTPLPGPAPVAAALATQGAIAAHLADASGQRGSSSEEPRAIPVDDQMAELARRARTPQTPYLVEFGELPDTVSVLQATIADAAQADGDVNELPVAGVVEEQSTVVLPENTEHQETVVLPDDTDVQETIVLPESGDHQDTVDLPVNAQQQEAEPQLVEQEETVVLPENAALSETAGQQNTASVSEAAEHQNSEDEHQQSPVALSDSSQSDAMSAKPVAASTDVSADSAENATPVEATAYRRDRAKPSENADQGPTVPAEVHEEPMTVLAEGPERNGDAVAEATRSQPETGVKDNSRSTVPTESAEATGASADIVVPQVEFVEASAGAVASPTPASGVAGTEALPASGSEQAAQQVQSPPAPDTDESGGPPAPGQSAEGTELSVAPAPAAPAPVDSTPASAISPEPQDAPAPGGKHGTSVGNAVQSPDAPAELSRQTAPRMYAEQSLSAKSENTERRMTAPTSNTVPQPAVVTVANAPQDLQLNPTGGADRKPVPSPSAPVQQTAPATTSSENVEPLQTPADTVDEAPRVSSPATDTSVAGQQPSAAPLVERQELEQETVVLPEATVVLEESTVVLPDSGPVEAAAPVESVSQVSAGLPDVALNADGPLIAPTESVRNSVAELDGNLLAHGGGESATQPVFTTGIPIGNAETTEPMFQQAHESVPNNAPESAQPSNVPEHSVGAMSFADASAPVGAATSDEKSDVASSINHAPNQNGSPGSQQPVPPVSTRPSASGQVRSPDPVPSSQPVRPLAAISEPLPQQASVPPWAAPPGSASSSNGQQAIPQLATPQPQRPISAGSTAPQVSGQPTQPEWARQHQQLGLEGDLGGPGLPPPYVDRGYAQPQQPLQQQQSAPQHEPVNPVGSAEPVMPSADAIPQAPVDGGETNVVPPVDVSPAPNPADHGEFGTPVLSNPSPQAVANPSSSSAARSDESEAEQTLVLTPVRDDAGPGDEHTQARYRIVTMQQQVAVLDTPVIVGRAPAADHSTQMNTPVQLLSVASPCNDVSRSHVEVRVAEGQCIITDLQSTNGSLVRAAEGLVFRLRPGESSVVTPGSIIDMGDGASFMVEVH